MCGMVKRRARENMGVGIGWKGVSGGGRMGTGIWKEMSGRKCDGRNENGTWKRKGE